MSSKVIVPAYVCVHVLVKAITTSIGEEMYALGALWGSLSF